MTLSAHSIQRQNPRIVAYTASKAALSSVTKNLSKSLAKDGILVNCVCPGTIVTASFTEVLKDILAADGLDRGHTAIVEKLQVELTEDRCTIRAAPRPSA